MVTRAAANLNGISIAYIMAVSNAAFACLVAFGVHLSDTQAGALSTLLNAVLVLAVHFSHRVGEATASGAAHAKAVESLSAAVDDPPPPGKAVAG